MNAPASLRAFYGASDKHAATVKSQIGAGSAREQEVCTPPEIADAVREFFGGAIALDPCGSPKGCVDALETWHGTKHHVTDRKGQPKYTKSGDPVMKWDGPGLERPWTMCTYFNPPYADLEDWLAHCLKQIDAAEGEIVGLMPFRTHRVWMWDYVDACTRICMLRPVKFLGYDQAFPDRLILSYHGERIEDFDSAFGALGACRTLVK